MSRPKIKHPPIAGKLADQIVRLHDGERCAVCGGPATKILILQPAAHEQTMSGKTMGLSMAACGRCAYDGDSRSLMNDALNEALHSPVRTAHILHEDGGISRCCISEN